MAENKKIKKRVRMPMEQRAKQFMPFAPLKDGQKDEKNNDESSEKVMKYYEEYYEEKC